MKHWLKRTLKKRILSSSGLRQTLNRISGDLPKVFVYHRFLSAEKRESGAICRDEFAWQLDQIKDRFNVITVAECIEYYRSCGCWPRQSVIITIDDGYRDFYEIAFPELVKRGLKATFYATVNFVDGRIWLWPDRLEYALKVTEEKSVRISIYDEIEEIQLNNELERYNAWLRFCNYCLVIPDDNKISFIESLLTELRVNLPEKPVAEYAAVTWTELKEVAGHGIEIGSHTLNHPIMSRLSDERASEEIGDSKKILEERLGTQVSSFCYPNSAPDDITDGVVAAVRLHGYSGAVFGINLKKWDLYRIPRMAVSDNREEFLWKLYGGESLTC